VPNGHLVGAWIALEDIAEDAGRFFVLPGSHQLDFEAGRPGKTHAEWLREIGDYVKQHPEKVAAPALLAGDVLFWNSRTVHGSLPTKDPRHSRKSLTAHFLPEGYKFGNLFSVKDGIQYRQHGRVSFYRNQPDYSLWNQLKYSVKVKAYNSPLLREGLRAIRNGLSRR
jgi:phytanoyl-CoA hydroxylase